MRQLIWQSSSHPRNLGVFRSGIEYIARVLCRHEIEEARRRIQQRGRRYFYNPSEEYIHARMSFFKPKNKEYGRIIRESPFKD